MPTYLILPSACLHRQRRGKKGENGQWKEQLDGRCVVRKVDSEQERGEEKETSPSSNWQEKYPHQPEHRQQQTKGVYLIISTSLSPNCTPQVYWSTSATNEQTKNKKKMERTISYLQLKELPNSLNSSVNRDKLNIVRIHNIQVIGMHPPHRLLHRGPHPLSRVIKLNSLGTISSNLGREVIGLAGMCGGDRGQGLAQDMFRVAVVGRGVEGVDTQVDGSTTGLCGPVGLDRVVELGEG